jgi:hypothetical protein
MRASKASTMKRRAVFSWKNLLFLVMEVAKVSYQRQSADE